MRAAVFLILSILCLAGLVLYVIGNVRFGYSGPVNIYLFVLTLCVLFVAGAKYLLRFFREFARILAKFEQRSNEESSGEERSGGA